MTESPLRIHWLAVVTALVIAVVLSACSDSPAPVSEPTPTPAPAPTYTPRPQPTPTGVSVPAYTPAPERTPTPAPAQAHTPTPESVSTEVPVPAYSSGSDLDANSLWQEAFDLFTASEQTCIRNELGDEFLESLLGVGILDHHETVELWHVSIFECLAPETANTLYISLINANVDLDEEAETCLHGVLSDIDIAEFLAASLPDATPDGAAMFMEVVGKIATCSESDLDANSLWQEAFDLFTASEQTCIRNELGDEFLESLLGVGILDDLETVELWHVSIFECLAPETANTLYISLINANVDLDEEAETCLHGVLPDIDIAEFLAASLPDATPDGAAMVMEVVGKIVTCIEYLLPPPGGGPAFGPPPPDESLIWQYNPGELLIVSPTVADGVVYAGSYEDRVYALDAHTGELLWSFETESDLSPPPLVAGGVVFVEDLANLYALDASTGELLWSDESGDGGSLYAPLVSDGTVYIPTRRRDSGFSVRAIDAVSGERLWEIDPVSSQLQLSFPLTASGGNVYVSDHFQLHALDSTTGRLVWSFDAGEVVPDPPTGSNGVVYLRSYAAAYALDESTGEQLWITEVDYGGLPDRPPFISDGVWPLVANGALRALDAATGQTLWTFEEDYALFVSGVANGMVFVTGIEAFHALDSATGDEIWSLDDDWNLGEVKEVDGVLYAHSDYLHTFDARTGDPIWSVQIGGYFSGPGKPYLVSGGVVYVGYRLADSGVYAFAAPGNSNTR